MADAGPDQAITALGTVVQLDGSHSFDPDGQPINYHWALTPPAGSNSTLSDPASAQPTFVADIHEDYSIQLIVTDSLGAASIPAVVKVSFNNVAPVADAGTSQSAVVRQVVTLNGSGSSDANGDPLRYRWSVASAPKRSSIAISNPTSPLASLVPDRPGSYVIQLIVNDGFVDSPPATAQILLLER